MYQSDKKAPKHAVRLMATDRLVLVGNANSEPKRILASVNRVLKSNQAPITLASDGRRNLPYNDAPNQSTQARFSMQSASQDETPVRVLTFLMRRADASKKPVTEAEVLQSVVALDKAILSGQLGNDVVSAAPNWLTVSSPPEQSAFGGPGARPAPVIESDPPHRVCFYPRSKPLETALSQAESASGVTVVILDTAPTYQTLRRYAAKIKNPLLHSLLPRLTIHIDRLIDAELTALSKANNYVHAHGHDYKMTSHGVFVAGLIHSIMPNADIHLVRVLNEYGVGTVSTVQRGIALAMQQRQGTMPIVINLSLTMVFPYLEIQGDETLPEWVARWSDLWGDLKAEKDKRLKTLNAYGSGKRAARTPLAAPQSLPDRLRYALEVATRKAYQEGALLVAAAGNAGRPGDVDLPMTQYPAAFDDVIGVGALKSLAPDVAPGSINSVEFTTYSCSVDKPAHEGFAVMGGDTEASDPEVSDDQRGMVGLWIGDPLPHGASGKTAPNPSWVRWSGTSFATPILTGALAVLLAQNNDRAAALQQLYDGWVERTNPPARIDTPQVVLARQEA